MVFVSKNVCETPLNKCWINGTADPKDLPKVTNPKLLTSPIIVDCVVR